MITKQQQVTAAVEGAFAANGLNKQTHPKLRGEIVKFVEGYVDLTDEEKAQLNAEKVINTAPYDGKTFTKSEEAPKRGRKKKG